jgi:hypothetical protein
MRCCLHTSCVHAAYEQIRANRKARAEAKQLVKQAEEAAEEQREALPSADLIAQNGDLVVAAWEAVDAATGAVVDSSKGFGGSTGDMRMQVRVGLREECAVRAPSFPLLLHA